MQKGAQLHAHMIDIPFDAQLWRRFYEEFCSNLFIDLVGSATMWSFLVWQLRTPPRAHCEWHDAIVGVTDATLPKISRVNAIIIWVPYLREHGITLGRCSFVGITRLVLL